MKHLGLLIVMAFVSSCASVTNYPDYWPEEAKSQGITKVRFFYEITFDDNCNHQVELLHQQHGKIFAELAEKSKTEIIRTSGKNYFYTEELAEDYLARVKEISPRWYKKLSKSPTPGETPASMTKAEEKEFPKIQALQQELLASRGSKLPAYAITRVLPSAGNELENVEAIFDESREQKNYLRLFECRFDQNDKLVDSTLYNIVNGKLVEAGDLETVKASDNRVFNILQVE